MKKLRLNCDDGQKLGSDKNFHTLVRLTPYQQKKMDEITDKFDWTELPQSTVMRVAVCSFINKFFEANIIKGVNNDFQNVKDIYKSPKKTTEIIKNSNAKIENKHGKEIMVTKKLLRDIADQLGGVEKLKEKLDGLKKEGAVS